MGNRGRGVRICNLFCKIPYRFSAKWKITANINTFFMTVNHAITYKWTKKRTYNVLAERGSEMKDIQFEKAPEQSKKRGKTLKDKNAFKNVHFSLDTLTQNWRGVLNDGCENRIPRTEFNVRQVFFKENGLKKSFRLFFKYGNFRFWLLFFILRKNGKEFCKTDCRFGLPDPDSL